MTNLLNKTLSNNPSSMMALDIKQNINNIFSKYRPIYDTKTVNKSFIKTCEQVRALGVKNCYFPLLLINPTLQGVDPYSPRLTHQQVLDIITECFLNMYYYLREVVRIPQESSAPVRYKMDRGTMAASYCFINDIDHYLMKPRQTGKSVGIDIELGWAFKFGASNSEFMFTAHEEDIAKKNLKVMTQSIANLPPYMANVGHLIVNNMGKVIRKTDNVKTYKEPGSNNTAVVSKPARSEGVAETINRGRTQPFQFYDEVEFSRYIDTIVKVSGMTFKTASYNSRKNGGHACRIFATTPGDLGDKIACQRALTMIDNVLEWNERFYDISPIELKKMIATKNEVSKIIYIKFTYKQLGLGETWFRSSCAQLLGDISKIRREILLERFDGNNRSPFTASELLEISENEIKPLKIEQVDNVGLYNVYIYEIPNKSKLYFISIDPSDGTGGDNFAVTVLDPYTLHTVAEFQSPNMTVFGLIDLIKWMIAKYIPKPLIIIEKNRNGINVIDSFISAGLERFLYHTPEANTDNMVNEKLDEKGFIIDKLERRKYYGVNTTTSSRPAMIAIILNVVKYSKELINTKFLIEDIKNLAIYRTQRGETIKATQGAHDDQVMSWAIAMYVRYYGKNLEKFGFNSRDAILESISGEDDYDEDEYLKLKKLYSDPRIKKEFPDQYEFFKDVLEEQLKKAYLSKKIDINKAIDGKIGGIQFKDAEFNNFDVVSPSINNDLIKKWNSLNK